ELIGSGELLAAITKKRRFEVGLLIVRSGILKVATSATVPRGNASGGVIMGLEIRRRSLLLGSAALLAGAALPRWSRAAGGSPTKLTVSRRTIVVKGRAAPAFGIVQPDGTSGLTIGPGGRFLVELVNDSGEKTIIHWHGQTPPYEQDGYIDEKG